MDLATEKAYHTPFTNSPMLPLLLLSLATQRNAPKTQNIFRDEYDYIIVGAGSAGATLAARLSEEQCVTVLLLEAGPGNPPLLNDIPALSRTFWFTNLDWQYKTVPQRYTGEALINRQLIWPSGKGLGGSSILNEMLFIRGNRKNYDDWAAQGAAGWSFKDVWPYFMKMEDNRDLEYVLNGYHGVGGPLTVERPRYQSEIKSPLMESAQKLGFGVGDSNAARQTGFHEFQATFRYQQRCSTAKAYLLPAENRTNLDILVGAHVRKIIFHKRRAMGVQFDYRNNTCEVKAKREVILSAGTTNTAQLLMLSGIGPREHLMEYGIPVVVDLPVGNNFHDHCTTFVPFTLDPKIPTVRQKLQDPRNIQEYIEYRSGPLSSPEHISAIAFLNSGPIYPDVDFPDFQLYFAEIPKEIPEHQIGFKPEVYKALFGPYENSPILACVVQGLQPKSRGTVRLQSSNPYDPPAIDPNYLENLDDLKVLVEGMKTCMKIVTADPMQKVGAKPFETIVPGCEQFAGNVDAYFTCIARSAVVTLSHQVGTAKMGDPRDPTSVVDPLLRVKFVEGLRVVDASIMPIVPSGNTYAPTVMVAEKAADIIKQTIRCPYHHVRHHYPNGRYSDINPLYNPLEKQH